MKIKGARALVTGGSQGIGLATAEALAKKGADVWIVARDADRLNEIASSNDRIHAFAGDLAVIATRNALVEEVGAIDLLVNNAGIGIYRNLNEISESQYRKMWELNVVAPVDLCQKVVPGMRERGRGHIVNMGSVAGYVSFSPIAFYSMSKFAIRAFTIGLRSELKGTGVGVSLITPGPVDTGFRLKAESADDSKEGTRGRGVSPEKVAKAVVKSISWNKIPMYSTIAVPRIGGMARLSDTPPFSYFVGGATSSYRAND